MNINSLVVCQENGEIAGMSLGAALRKHVLGVAEVVGEGDVHVAVEGFRYETDGLREKPVRKELENFRPHFLGQPLPRLLDSAALHVVTRWVVLFQVSGGGAVI